jgi:nicotinate-nucleotide--dimethylbenzimidazole phosphoribosyltransferase
MIDLQRYTDLVLPDREAADAARARQSRLTKPTGALGRLEELSIWWCAVRGTCPAPPPQDPVVLLFAGDHGVAKAGVSAYPPEVTAQMVGNFLGGGAAVNVLANRAGARVRVADLAVDADYDALGIVVPPQLTEHRVRRGSGDIRTTDALTVAEAAAAMAAGAELADAEIDAGADLLITGDMGIGNTTPATVLIHLLAGGELVDVVGRGTGIDDAGWMRKAAAVRDAARRGRPHLADPVRLLSTVGGADLAAMTGLLLQASYRRTPVLLDGIVSGAAALVADRISFRARDWWLAGHRSTEPAHAAALDRLRLTPVLDFSLRLGEGTGALLALPILQAAAATLAEMATFESAHVSDRSR